MPTSKFMAALNALCHERDLPREIVIQAVESALKTAYKRDYGAIHNVSVTLDQDTGQARVFAEKEVVEDVIDDRTEVALEDAREYDPDVELGDVIEIEMTPENFGRIAAQTAKQVIMQRIREAERDKVFTDFASREREIVIGTVQSIDPKTKLVRLSLGRAEAILPRQEQIPGEKYRVGQRIRVFIYDVNRTNRGPQIQVSRTHTEMLRRLLELEVPEIKNGTVEIRGIAREPGARSKVAVSATQLGVDPVGACVGMRGMRIQNIVNELSGEKIDIVQWSPEESQFVANALSPAKVINVFLDEDNADGKTAIVVVPDKQLSLAIGKEGQNARLSAKLTGWRIDIKSASEAADEAIRRAEEEARRKEEEEERRREREEKLEAARALLAEAEAAEEDEAEEPEEEVLEPAAEAPEPVAAEATVEAPTAEPEEERVEEPAAEATVEVEAVREAPEAAEDERPDEEEKPALLGDEFFREDLAAAQDEEEPEEKDEERKRRGPDERSLADLFYTLNERGEQIDLEDEMRSRRKKGKKNKKDKKKGRR